MFSVSVRVNGVSSGDLSRMFSLFLPYRYKAGKINVR